MEFVGISEMRDLKAGSLPFAHQSAVGIATALATNPSMLLLDEPLAGMNQTEAKLILDLTRKIQAKGVTVLLVEHNMRAIMSISEYIVVLNEGKKIAEGAPEEIAHNEAVISAYLGGGKYRA
jgi:branched-chain amino acid transport system ATP-binding protein